MKAAYAYIILALLSIPAMASITSLYATCCGEESFMARPSSNGMCSWEQGDGRCDGDGQCCPGRKCSALGFCENC